LLTIQIEKKKKKKKNLKKKKKIKKKYNKKQKKKKKKKQDHLTEYTSVRNYVFTLKIYMDLIGPLKMNPLHGNK